MKPINIWLRNITTGIVCRGYELRVTSYGLRVMDRELSVVIFTANQILAPKELNLNNDGRKPIEPAMGASPSNQRLAQAHRANDGRRPIEPMMGAGPSSQRWAQAHRANDGRRPIEPTMSASPSNKVGASPSPRSRLRKNYACNNNRSGCCWIMLCLLSE